MEQVDRVRVPATHQPKEGDNMIRGLLVKIIGAIVSLLVAFGLYKWLGFEATVLIYLVSIQTGVSNE